MYKYDLKSMMLATLATCIPQLGTLFIGGNPIYVACTCAGSIITSVILFSESDPE